MKKIIAFTALFFCIRNAMGQVLLEDKNGDVIVRNQFHVDGNASFIKLNTGDQSLGFTYITTNRNFRPSSYRISEFGVKAKPTEGFASVFANSQFSPGVKFSYSLTKVRIFSHDDPPRKAGFFDWGGLEINYDVNKYSLYRADTTFVNQFYSKTFKPLSLFLNYNYFVTQGELNSKLLISFKGGYSRRSTYDDLKTIEIQDITSITDPATLTTRQVINKRSARAGQYQEFDAYPLSLAFTFLTKTDAPTIIREFDSVVFRQDTATRGDTILITRSQSTVRVQRFIPNPDVKKLRLGITAYLKNIASNNLPNTRIGAIFFLTKQDEKTGARAPVFGITIQADDPFDVNKVNNGLQNRIAVGFTSVFTL